MRLVLREDAGVDRGARPLALQHGGDLAAQPAPRLGRHASGRGGDVRASRARCPCAAARCSGPPAPPRRRRARRPRSSPGAAPRSAPVSSTVGPRPLLMKIALFFMARNSRSPIMWCVSELSGACMDRKSERWHSSIRLVTGSTPTAVISSSARNGIVGDHPQAEGVAAARHRLGHVAEGDQADGLAVEPRDVLEVRPALRPLGVDRQLVHQAQPAVGGEEHGHGVVGHLVDEDVGHVGDHDARLGGRVHVHRVGAHAAEPDDLAVLRAP